MTSVEPVELRVGERTVRITSPDRVYFSARGETKLDLARYYMSVGAGRDALCEYALRKSDAEDGENEQRVPNV